MLLLLKLDGKPRKKIKDKRNENVIIWKIIMKKKYIK